MDEVLQKASRGKGESKARVVEYVELRPRETLFWRLERDAELRVCESALWLTREGDLYDYWLVPGDVACLSRGERVWVSADWSRERPFEASLTTYRSTGLTRARRGFAWLRRLWPRVARGSNASAF